VFGRWFCGWACHVVALQDASAWLLGKFGLRPRPVRSRLLVLAPWVVAGHMFAWPLIESWLSRWPGVAAWLGLSPRTLPSPSKWELHLTTTELWQTFPGPLMGVLTFVVVGFLVVWWLGAKGFCTHGCPYGAFFAVADRFAPMRIKVTDACDACGHCTTVCTSNVRVHEEVAKHRQLVDPGCMKCMDCVSVCPKDALYVGFALPKPFATSQQRIKARADFTWPEELLLAAVALFATQWAFRGAWFREAIPFLMAVGLGAITAVFTLLFVRLLLRRDVTFQHTVLKTNGVRTRAGRWTLLGLGAWLLFTAHTFVANRNRIALFDDVRALPAQATRAQIEQVLAEAQSAHAWDLVDDPLVSELRGLLLWRLGREPEGAEWLLTAYDARGGRLETEPGRLNLAMACMPPRGDHPKVAENLVRQVLALNPQNTMAQQMLQFLEDRKK
jgi:polyferredoxin